MDNGWNMRADILRRDAQSKLLEPLQRHGWRAEIKRVEANGEYVLIETSRNNVTHTAALLYSCATSNQIYRNLDKEVDLILFNGQPYQVEHFAQGLSRPPSSADDFQRHMIEWNRESEPGRIAQDVPAEAIVEELPPRIRRLISETPIDAVWLRLSRLKSATLARKAVAERASVEGVELSENILVSKGDGVAYAIRNATDYFSSKEIGNISQRVLNLYYGILSFVLAEMLAAPHGPAQLEEVEEVTKQGHGLWSLDPDGTFGAFCLGPLQAGLFPMWMKAIGSIQLPTVAKKPRKQSDLAAAPANSWITMEQLFARIPEIGDLFEDVFSGPPAWVTPVPDMTMNMSGRMFSAGERLGTT